MSESLSQWICQYLVDIAQQYGAQVSSFPTYKKKKRVQITEFLWAEPTDDNSSIWANVSDKLNTIPVKFTADAVKAFNSGTSSGLHENKGSIMQMTDFKIILTRLPNVGATSAQGTMTKDAFLSLECHSVTFMGAPGSGVFGMPKQVNSDPKVKEWLLGLREGGGGGNVLRDRFKEQKQLDPPKEAAGSIQGEEVEDDTRTSLSGVAKNWKDLMNNMDYRWIPKEMINMIDGNEEEDIKQSMSPKWDMEEKMGSVLDSSHISLSHARPTLPRKVPRPPSPSPRGQVVEGPTRVLAPNSDTSGTQSQSQSQPQSQLLQVKSAGVDQEFNNWIDIETIIRILLESVVNEI